MKFSNCRVKQRKNKYFCTHIQTVEYIATGYMESKNIHGQKKLSRAIKKKDLNIAQRSAYTATA